MKLFKKPAVSQLDLEIASQILEQVFEANDMELNSISLEALASYSNYRKERFTLQRTILVIVMALFILLPLLFIPASFTINDPSSQHGFNPVYRMEVDSFMLVERVTATIDGYNVPVYEMDSHVYSIEPPTNGLMEVTVTLANRQRTTQYVEVTTVDREVPTATACTKDGDLINLYLSDGLSGVDFEKLRAVDLDGREVVPISIDEKTGCVTFDDVNSTLNVFVPDAAGNQLHLIISLQ